MVIIYENFVCINKNYLYFGFDELCDVYEIGILMK